MDILERVIAKKLYGGSGGGSTEEEWYITDASCLFYDGARLSIKDALLSKLKDVTDMHNMFYYCYDLTELDVSKWDTSQVTNMNSMFSYCTGLTELDVSKWDTSNVTNVASMFNGCSNLVALNLSSWDLGKVSAMNGLFTSCRKMEELIGFSATNKGGITITFPYGTSTKTAALKRLTFRTDLPDGVYSIRSAISIPYCSFEREGMVETFNTLPDISGISLDSSYKTITITGNPCVTDGSLTPEDEAIATAKGWTLVK